MNFDINLNQDLVPAQEIEEDIFPVLEPEAPNPEIVEEKPAEVVWSTQMSYKHTDLKSNSRDKPFKAQYADRRDVVYKTLLRSVRRFLWDDFTAEIGDVAFSSKTRGCDIFQSHLSSFHKQNFKDSPAIFENLQTEKEFLDCVSVFMTHHYLIPKRSTGSKKISLMLKKIVKKFSPKLYTKFFKLQGVSEFFKILKDSGYIYKIIDAYPNMKKCEDQYIKAVDSIINFSHSPELMK